MRKLFLLAFIGTFIGLFATETRAQIIPEILKRIEDHNQALQSVKANITMVKFESTLNDSSTQSGSITYLPKTQKRAMYARLDWQKPREEYLSVSGDNFEMYSPKRNLVYFGKTDKAKGSEKAGSLLSMLNMSRKDLKASFQVVYLGQESIGGSVSVGHLRLDPKVKVSYKFAEIWVDSDGMVRQSKITEKNNDSTTINLSGIKKNERIETSVFTLVYPKTVEKQRV